MWPSISELIATGILFIWVVFLVTILTKKTYMLMLRRGLQDRVAVYYSVRLFMFWLAASWPS